MFFVFPSQCRSIRWVSSLENFGQKKLGVNTLSCDFKLCISLSFLDGTMVPGRAEKLGGKEKGDEREADARGSLD
jgi:hypothetical protein